MRTPYRLLPNVVAEEEICPEFIPHVGGSGPIVRQATRFLADSKHAAGQRDALALICQRFAGKRPAEESAACIVEFVKRAIVEKRDEG